jgi:hypothetical protein
MVIEYTAATVLAGASMRIVIFSPPFFAAVPRLPPPAVASAAPNGIYGPSGVANEPTVKNSNEAYPECLARCARGLRCRKCGGTAAATDLRNCALCAATSSPGRSRAQERVWADIMQRSTCNGNAND